jgi:MFS family permease
VRLFLVYNLASNVGIGVFTLIYNLYLLQLGLREDYIGAFNSVATLAMAGAALLMGALINRYGVWRCVTVGMIAFLLSSLLLFFITDPAVLLVMSGLNGAATAFLFVPTMPFIVDLTRPSERHGVAALAFSLQSLSMTVGSLVGGWLPRLLAVLFGLESPSAAAFRYTLVAGIALAALAIIPLWLMSDERKRARPGEDEPTRPDVASDVANAPTARSRAVRRTMVVFIAVGGLMSLGAGAVFPFYNVFLKNLGASSGQIGLIYSSAGLMAAGMGLLSPWLARRIGSLRSVVLIRLAPVPFYLLLVATPWMPLAIFSHMIRTTSINMAWPIDSTYISEILPARARAQVFSFRSGAWNLGWSLSSLVAGRLIVDYGYDVSFIAYVGFMSAAMVLFYVYFARSTPVSMRASDSVEAAPVRG